MKNIKFVIILLLVSVIFISGCAQSGDTSTTKEIKAKKKLTITSYCKSTGEPPPCAANDTIVNVTTEPPPTCTESWSCGEWSICSGGSQTRTCTDANKCGTTTSKPTTTQSCGDVIPKCTESWSCGPWSPSTCPESGQQTRTCTDANNCGTTTNKLAISQSCGDPVLPPTSDCVVTYTPPKEQWTYGTCVNGQKARITEVAYSYKGKDCKISEIEPKKSEPCTSDPTTSATPTTTTSASPSPTDVIPSCTESWSCGSWSPDPCPESGQQTRTCTDANNCGTTTNKPAISQACTLPCVLSTYGDPCTTYFYEQRYIVKNGQPMRQKCEKVWDAGPCYHQKFFADYMAQTCTYGACQTQPPGVTGTADNYPKPEDTPQYTCKTSESDTC